MKDKHYREDSKIEVVEEYLSWISSKELVWKYNLNSGPQLVYKCKNMLKITIKKMIVPSDLWTAFANKREIDQYNSMLNAGFKHNAPMFQQNH
ncbi:hypothetical protein [Williamsoniiplasma lucivorax]|uniref:Uncharacterized protein n=1 Tax=Williamsoniiplasma lucivorax TaxID=209274 RepID=A0A2S5RD74_9MOLU|nr:hypothetical protein [Williamsoniiplasma lucivorax]PPE05248.1 hypothetical protein ELUCI_v1c07840 [Williamsoniiplasma lucivorax]